MENWCNPPLFSVPGVHASELLSFVPFYSVLDLLFDVPESKWQKTAVIHHWLVFQGVNGRKLL